MPPGSFFHVHVDRNVAYDTGLRRRLAMIIFLNKAWKPEYGGQLELWSADGLHREVAIEPIFNRTVIFEVASPNYHGVPAPIASPAGRSRNSFLVYCHTVGTDGSEDIAPHSLDLRAETWGPGGHRRPTDRQGVPAAHCLQIATETVGDREPLIAKENAVDPS